MQVKRNTLHVLQLVIDMIHIHGECSSVDSNFFLAYTFSLSSSIILQQSFQRTHEMCQNNSWKCQFYPRTVLPECATTHQKC